MSLAFHICLNLNVSITIFLIYLNFEGLELLDLKLSFVTPGIITILPKVYATEPERRFPEYLLRNTLNL
jgi:hypothetical protein